MRRRHLLLGGLALVLLASGGLVARGIVGSPPVACARAVRAEFSARVACDGALRAGEATPVSVPTEVSGPVRIAWIAADGAAVRSGDVLVRFDPTEFEVALRKGRDQRAAAEHGLDRADAEAKATRRGLELDAAMAGKELDNARTFALKDAEIYSRFDIIGSELDADLAAARREHAENVRATKEQVARNERSLIAIEKRKGDLDVAEAEHGLAALEVRAPHDGVLVLQRDWRGNTPRVGDTVWRGYKLAEIPRLDRMEAEVSVLEADAGGLAVGQKAEVELDSSPGVSYPGKLRQLDTLARPRRRGSPLQYFNAIITLDGAAAVPKRPGQRVRAVVTLAGGGAAILVPRQAVFSKGGAVVVYRRTLWNRFEQRPVKLGAAAQGRVVIESGLAEGDVVALTDPTRAEPTPSPAAGAGSRPRREGT